jgi:hypothetical protein
MSKESIIETLSAKQALTSAEIQVLRTKPSDLEFFSELIRIYENKVTKYLSSSERSMKRSLLQSNAYPPDQIATMAVQHQIDFGFSVILEHDKASLLISLLTLLKANSPDLAVSLGMSTVKVFTCYLARYRLFMDVTPSDLEEFRVPDLFPDYLLQAFIQQQGINQAIQSSITDELTEDANVNFLWSRELANNISAVPALFYQCLYGLVFYVNNILKSTIIDPVTKRLFFSHLDNNESLAQFTDLLCRGYIQEASNIEQQIQIYAANDAILLSEYKQSCMPSICFLGIRVRDEFIVARQTKLRGQLELVQAENSAINARAQTLINQSREELRGYLATIEANKASIDQQSRELQAEANRKIDAARAQFKPQWSVGFGPEGIYDSRPGISFKF